MPNQFIQSILLRLREPENKKLFNNTENIQVIFTRYKKDSPIFFSYYPYDDEDIFMDLREVYQLYIIRIALKAIPYYRKSTKGWVLFDKQFPSIEKQKAARLLYPKYPESLCDAYLHALNQDDWMAACEQVWVENEGGDNLSK